MYEKLVDFVVLSDEERGKQKQEQIGWLRFGLVQL